MTQGCRLCRVLQRSLLHLFQPFYEESHVKLAEYCFSLISKCPISSCCARVWPGLMLGAAPGALYMSRPVMSGPGLYDPTTIMNADILAYCQKEGWCKLAFYLLSFFYYLYGMIYVLVSS
uniref:Uncharacterized protein n=1 Tax=Pavo cristatus TaxID=9049 RepID=A0A8C9FNT0_PAVCR